MVVIDNLQRGIGGCSQRNTSQLDLHETGKLQQLLKDERVEAVIHFAAYISVGESTQVPIEYFINNVSGSLSLFNAMLKAGVKRLVFSSTAAAYGIPRPFRSRKIEPILAD